jgi:hypothetical protein
MVPTTGLKETTVELNVSSIRKLNVWLDTNSAISSATASMTVISTGSLSVSSTLLDSLLEEDEGLGLKVPGDRCARSTVAVSNLLLMS